MADSETIRETIRVGFGPRTTNNSFLQSGVKVARELARDPRFECGHFEGEPFDFDELASYDVLVFIKYPPDASMLARLKAMGRKLVLDYQDMFLFPSVYEDGFARRWLKRLYYLRTELAARAVFDKMDSCLICTPLLEPVVRRAGMRPVQLPRQIYNDSCEHDFKHASEATRGVTLYWTGVGPNQVQNEPVLPVLRRLHENHGCRILYCTDTVGEVDFIEYRPFRVQTWEREMLEADIAFRWRDASSLQRFKDPNKLLAYMAAGLPAVIHPTASELTVVKDGVTGFFARTPEEFEEVLVRLVREPRLRRKVGERAHETVWQRHSLARHVELLKNHLLELAGGPRDGEG